MVSPTKSKQKSASTQAPQQGEVIWIDVDPQSGHEKAGRLPALVISQTAYNQRLGRAFVCPITSKVKGYPFEVPIQTASVSGVVLSDHFKNLDWKARGTTCTGEFAQGMVLQKVWRLVESVVGLS
jgi:mRNA interferase MazF